MFCMNTNQSQWNLLCSAWSQAERMKYSLDVRYLHCSIHNSREEVGKDVAIVFSYISLSSLKWLKKGNEKYTISKKALDFICATLHELWFWWYCHNACDIKSSSLPQYKHYNVTLISYGTTLLFFETSLITFFNSLGWQLHGLTTWLSIAKTHNSWNRLSEPPVFFWSLRQIVV